jgi:GTPase
VPPSAPTLDQLEAGVRCADRVLLARAITLVESHRPEDQARAGELLARLADATGGAHRVGLSGVPGVGKSTLIEALGTRLVEAGRRVAVLAVDPSSTLSGGSILGDKARMDRLAQLDQAFIRPSPSAASLGGVARRTRETMLLCEAAGFDVVLVETVGVGQSEVAVSELVDTFVVLMMPGAGDELQGIKKGILELADLVVVNKADGDLLPRARVAAADYSAALRYGGGRAGGGAWTPCATLVSARTGEGLDELWSLIEEHRGALEASGELESRRKEQQVRWMWRRIEERLLAAFKDHAQVGARLTEVQDKVRAGKLTPEAAAEALLVGFLA